RCVGAVDAILRAGDVHRPRAERVTRTTGCHARQIRLACEHFSRWIPVGPLGLALDRLHTGPGEPFTSDADSVPDRLTTTEDVVKISVRRIDDDGAGRFVTSVADNLPAKVGWKLRRLALLSRCGLHGLRRDLGRSGQGEESEERFGVR